MTQSRAKLLYWCHDINYTAKEKKHAHPFWQVEICVEAPQKADTSAGEIILEPGDVLIVPPENWHVFYYGKVPQEAYSFKFELDFPRKNLRPLKIDRPMAKNFCETIHGLLKKEKESNLFVSSKRILIEYLLEDIVDCGCSNDGGFKAEPEFVQKAKEIIYTYCKTANVAFVAEKLGWSSGHLKFMFKKEFGMSAKKFIDIECLKLIGKHLSYSDLNVSRIAEMMNFPDVYAFSRFYKRMTGKSPSEFRKAADQSSA